MNDPAIDPVVQILTREIEAWKSLFYWACGGMATALVGTAIYIKGMLTEHAETRSKEAEGKVLLAESNKSIASALAGLAEVIRGSKG